MIKIKTFHTFDEVDQILQNHNLERGFYKGKYRGKEVVRWLYGGQRSGFKYCL